MVTANLSRLFVNAELAHTSHKPHFCICNLLLYKNYCRLKILATSTIRGTTCLVGPETKTTPI